MDAGSFRTAWRYPPGQRIPCNDRNPRMSRTPAIILIAVCASVLGPSTGSAQSGPDPVTMAKAAHWWMTEGGPKLQRILGHKGFRGPVPSIPIWIRNQTTTPVTFYVESEDCPEYQAVYPSGESGTFDCPGTGDDWYNIAFFDGWTVQRFSVDGGKMFYFSRIPTANGRPRLVLLEYVPPPKR